MNKTVTVDGPAGSGKSSIAKMLSGRINYTYLDTGAIYRSLTYYFQKQEISPRDRTRLESELNEIKLVIKDGQYELNGENITEAIRGEDVDKAVAMYAQISEVREYVRSLQTRIADQNDTVIDGRDIGTEIFPDAFCKFYLDARLAVRAQRRFEELEKRSMLGDRTLETVVREVALRDKMDQERKNSPLRIPNDALVIDSSELNLEEVLESMVHQYNRKIQLESGDLNLSSDPESQQFFEAMQQDAPQASQVGKFIEARVISIGEEIFLDINRKVDAYIPKEEVAELDTSEMAVGDVIQVVERDYGPGVVRVSKRDADRRQGLLKLSESHKANELVTGKVKDVNKGGYIIDIDDTEAFCPLSEYDVFKAARKQDEIGVESQFEILNLSVRNVIVSRKRPLERLHIAMRDEFFKTVQVGDRFPAEVVHVMDYRVIVRIKEGVNAIIRQKEFSWTRGGRQTSQFQKGNTFDVQVIHIDRDQQRLEVSKRLVESDPFSDFSQKYSEGDLVNGRVVSTERYGVFVEVEDGVDGMIHVSDLSWFHKVVHPNDVVSIGDTLQVRVLSINSEDRRLSLGLKQVEVDPWTTMEQMYPVGSTIEMKIVSVIKNGLYGLCDDKVDTFLHVSDMPYHDKDKDMTTLYNAGDTVQGNVLRINKHKHRLEMDLAQKSETPWEDLLRIHERKDIVIGEVIEFIENGAQIKVLDEIIGFCHVSQLDEEEVAKAEDAVTIGERYSFMIQFIDVEKEKLSLSRKEFLASEKYRKGDSYNNANQRPEGMTVDSFIERDRQS